MIHKQDLVSLVGITTASRYAFYHNATNSSEAFGGTRSGIDAGSMKIFDSTNTQLILVRRTDRWWWCWYWYDLYVGDDLIVGDDWFLRW